MSTAVRFSKFLENFAPVCHRKRLDYWEIKSQESIDIHSIDLKRLIFSFSLRYECITGNYEWEINRYYSEFKKLNYDLHTEFKMNGIEGLPVFPGEKEMLSAEADKKLELMEVYFKELCENQLVLKMPVFYEFIEVSCLSYDGASTVKRKEGWVWKRTGGRVGNERRFWNCAKYCKRLQKRWLIIRDNMLGYVSDSLNGSLHEVLMFKGRFEILVGENETGYQDGIRVITLRRDFIFRAGDLYKRDEWVNAIKEAYDQSEWTVQQARFDSSFPVRDSNDVKFYVDGKDYFKDVYKALKKAKREVFISDWWLSPEMYLLRPASKYPQTQVREILGTLADNGVQVFVHVYKEVSFALTLNSMHTKDSLISRNPNIKVIRHPHRSVVGGEFLWSHHEKIVCIDQEVAFIGGLDLCYGRMDSPRHVLRDDQEPFRFNGIDYSNSRVADFTDVENWERDMIKRDCCPRMPWHDLAIRCSGKAASDIALHFIELWNHVMTDITGVYHRKKDLLQPNTSVQSKNILKRRNFTHATVIKTIAEVSSGEDSVSISESRSVESNGGSVSLPHEELKSDTVEPSIKKIPFPLASDFIKSGDSGMDVSHSGPREDVYRSRSFVPTNRTDIDNRLHLRVTFSAGAPNKHIDVQDLDCKIDSESEMPSSAIPISNAPFETGLKKQLTSMIKGMTPSSDRQVVIKNTKIALMNTDMTSSNASTIHDTIKPIISKDRSIINHDFHSQTMPHEMVQAREKMEREDEGRERKKLEADQDQGDETWAKNLILPEIKEYKKEGSCECQVVRSAGIWSLGLEKTEHSIHTAYLHMIDEAEHFIYIENQFFISSTAGDPVKNQIAQALVERIKVAAEYEEQFKVIVVMPLLPAFEGAVDDPAAAVLRVQLYWEYQTISRGVDSIINQLKECSYIKDPFDYISFYGLRTHDMLDSGPVTEIVYVHSKCMIVDDDKAIIGSANINDRSQLGRNDSEIAMIIKDKNKLRTVINGMPRYVSSSVHKFRMKIFKEHSGIEDEEYLRDPLSAEFNQIWNVRARENTEFYRHVFRAYPDDEILSIRDRQEFEAQAKIEDYEILAADIKGHLVEFPLNFLKNEDLRISIFNKEYYIPEENFV